MSTKLQVFIAGFIQVVLVSVNTWQLAHEKFLGAFIVGFCISMVWAINIKKVVLGNRVDKIFYAFGAGLGSMMGIFISKLIYT